jgi:methylmalonyl-CoA mutase
MKPDFSKIKFNQFKPDLSSGKHNAWLSSEKIEIKPSHTKDDLKTNSLKDFSAGIAPFLRGPYATMYTVRPWTIRQYA